MADAGSIYNTTPAEPFNALTAVGQYAGVANALTQNQIMGQQLQQQKVATQRAAGQQVVSQLVGQYTDPATGKLDALGFKAAAAKIPMAAMNWDMVSGIADPMLTPEHVGYQANGTPRIVAKGEAQQELANASNPHPSAPNANAASATGIQPQPQAQQQPAQGNQQPPGIAGGLPPGMEEQIGERTATNQDYISNTRDAAGEASNQVVMLDKIKALAKKTQTGPYAERINKWHAGLAELFGTDANSPATYEQLNKYMLANGLGQAAQNGANSDARTLAYVNSNPNTGILPEAVLPLAEYQQSLYRQKMGERDGLETALHGINPNSPDELNKTVENYRHVYSNNTSPLFYEYKNLPNADAKKTFIASHPGFAAQANKLKTLKSLGAID